MKNHREVLESRRAGRIAMLALGAFAMIGAGVAITSLPSLRRYLRMHRM